MKKLLYPFLAAIVCLACEKTIDIDVPVDDSKIVLHSFLNPDSTIKVHLTKSVFVLEDSYEQKLLEGATVSVFEEGKKIGQMEYLQNGFYELTGVKPTIGKTYRLEVEKAGFDKVTASEQVLPVVSIGEFSLDTVESIENGYPHRKAEISFVIEDPVGENYYIPTAYHYIKAKVTNPYDNTVNTVEYLSPFNFESPDPFVESFCSSNCFSVIKDPFFDGKRYKVKLEGNISYYPEEWEVEEEYYYIKLYNVSPSYYFYYATLENNYGSGEDPFSEPTPVFTNVEGGYGVVSSLSASFKKF